jgi:hypothetical protein
MIFSDMLSQHEPGAMMDDRWRPPSFSPLSQRAMLTLLSRFHCRLLRYARRRHSTPLSSLFADYEYAIIDFAISSPLIFSAPHFPPSDARLSSRQSQPSMFLRMPSYAYFRHFFIICASELSPADYFHA